MTEIHTCVVVANTYIYIRMYVSTSNKKQFRKTQKIINIFCATICSNIIYHFLLHFFPNTFEAAWSFPHCIAMYLAAYPQVFNTQFSCYLRMRMHLATANYPHTNRQVIANHIFTHTNIFGVLFTPCQGAFALFPLHTVAIKVRMRNTFSALTQLLHSLLVNHTAQTRHCQLLSILNKRFAAHRSQLRCLRWCKVGA